MKFRCSALLAILSLASFNHAETDDNLDEKRHRHLKIHDVIDEGEEEGPKYLLDTSDMDNFVYSSKISIDLPNGKTRTFDHKKGSSEERSYYGEDKGSTMNLLHYESFEGVKVIAGSISNLEDDLVCHIGHDSKGVAHIGCTPSSEFPDEGDAVMPEDDEDDEEEAMRDAMKSHLRVQSSSDDNKQGVVADDGSIIDIMVLWTKKAECKKSRLTPKCNVTDHTKANMEAHVILAVDETNTAYVLSGIETQLRLVHFYRDEDYFELPNKSGFSTALGDITKKGDGKMDDVHEKRALYGADVVALMIQNKYYCGLAHSGPGISRMFSVTSWSCATGYYSFGHEIGHNMGCTHDRGTKNACSNSNYNYGYRDPDAEFRTIMAYSCKAGQCDNNAGGWCSKVQRFSNTEFTYLDKPLGTSNANVARKINEVKAKVAGFYASGDPCDVEKGGCFNSKVDATKTNLN